MSILPILIEGLGLAARASPPASRPEADPIAAGFRGVPPEARMRMFWRIFGPAWTPAEIDFQLEQLQRAGVGGVMTCFTYPVALDDPERGIRNQPFLSAEFLETLRYAAGKARQLGLQFDVCGGTGWPFGGPQVTLPDSAQRLRMETLVPLPAGGSCTLPPLRERERYLAAFWGSHDVTTFIDEDRLELPMELATTDADRPAPGREDRTSGPVAPEAEPRGAASPIRVFIAGPTFMKVKRPSLGGEGYVLDHYSRAAARRYLDAVVAPMLRAAPNGLIHTLFCDSLEVYRSNWTHDFAAQFQRRRGYNLIPRLPELFDDTAPAAPDLRFDFWRTAAELAEEQFAGTVHHWCREQNVAFALEPYGTPPMGFTAGRRCDVPWGEQYEWKGFSFSRFAASAGHLAGKRIIGAEAWTWTGIPNRLADSLSDLKLCSDLHFLAGENELTGVDFPYSPRSAGAPGWLPYFGPVMSPNNPQWLCFPDLAQYVSRCQWLLRQGRPVADVALYTPTEDAFAGGPADQMLLDFQLRDRLVTGERTDEFGLAKALRHQSDLIYTVLTGGYNFDGIDFFAMNQLSRVRARELVAGDGRYRIVVLPNLAGMELTALEKIARFCHRGGTVIATRRLPDHVYGAAAPTSTRRAVAMARLQTLLQEMFGPPAGHRAAPSRVTVHSYGHGRAIFTPDDQAGLSEALARSGIEPDLQVFPAQSQVSHVHRALKDRDLYFIVNVGAQPARFTASFRTASRAVSLWDPMKGAITSLPAPSSDGDRTQVELVLPARGSIFVCLARATSTHKEYLSRSSQSETIDAESLDASAFSPSLVHSTGAISQPLDLLWHVAFDGPDAPPPYETRELVSWTRWPGGQFFSGLATYTGMFECLPRPGSRSWLHFEQVHEAAVVSIDGRRAGSVWTPPYELEVTRFLRPGIHRLDITVANLPVNRVLGLPDPDLRALRAVYGERFPDSEEKRLMAAPASSGLIGPVELISSTEIPHSPR